MRLDEPPTRRALRRCRVARLATLSPRGRPTVTPLWFVRAGDRILLGTSSWTRAARNVAADARVGLLFEPESSRAGDALRAVGTAELRTDRRIRWALAWRSALRYVLAPGSLRNTLAHRRQHRLRLAYYAQSSARGRGCVLVVSVHGIEPIARAGRPPAAGTRPSFSDHGRS